MKRGGLWVDEERERDPSFNGVRRGEKATEGVRVRLVKAELGLMGEEIE